MNATITGNRNCRSVSGTGTIADGVIIRVGGCLGLLLESDMVCLVKRDAATGGSLDCRYSDSIERDGYCVKVARKLSGEDRRQILALAAELAEEYSKE